MTPYLWPLLLSADLILASTTQIDNPGKALDVSVLRVSQLGLIDVKIKNSGESPTRVWKESNSWGAGRWRVVRLRKGEFEVYFQDPNQRFTRNIPTFFEVRSHESVDVKLDLNGGNWCLRSHCSSRNERGISGKEVKFERGDAILVIYDVPWSQQAIEADIWYGVTAASADFDSR